MFDVFFSLSFFLSNRRDSDVKRIHVLLILPKGDFEIVQGTWIVINLGF